MKDLTAILYRLPWGANLALAVLCAASAAFFLPDTAPPSPLLSLSISTTWIGCAFFLIGAINTAIRNGTRGDLIRSDYHLQDLEFLTLRELEILVGILFQKRGFKIERRGSPHPNEDIDLVVTKNGKTALIRCEQSFDHRVGVQAARELLGVVITEKANTGYLVTTEGFTDETHAFAQQTKKLRLINGCDLLRVMHSLNLTPNPTPSSPPYRTPTPRQS